MKLDLLVSLGNEMVAKIEELDGYIFLDRFGDGVEGLRKKVLVYENIKEAQSWLNIVLIDQLITQIVGEEWDLDDPGISQILSAIEKAWAYQIEANFPDIKFSISRILDPDYGDVGLKLTNTTLTEEEVGG